MKKRKKSGEGSPFRALIIGTLVHGAFFTFSILIGAAVLYAGKNPTAIIEIAALTALIAGGALSGFSVSKKCGAGGFAKSSASAVIFTLIMIIIGALICGGSLSQRALMNYTCYLPTAVLFAYIATRKPQQKRHKRR